MHFVREIRLRRVKCAAAHKGIYFISHFAAKAKYFTMTTGHYFTSEGYFTFLILKKSRRRTVGFSLCKHTL